jgi:acyl-CoA thioester hydrolase
MQSKIPKHEYSSWTYEKLRYADTDCQGHVNNAIYATILETGRVELLYNTIAPLNSENCSFVVSIQLDLRAEITWPGNVDIGTRVVTVGRSSLTLEQALFQNGLSVAAARTVVVQMNETTRSSQPLSDESVQRLSELIIVP